MITPVLILSPQWDATQRIKAESWVTELGDSYQQTAIAGQPSILEEWDIQSTGYSQAEIDALIGELSVYSGVTEFQWQPEPTTPFKVYVCPEWSVVPLGKDVWQIQATFVERPNAQCEAFRNDINVNTLKSRLAGALSFLNTYRRATQPLILNAQYVLVNAFHDVLGRGGYFPPSAGTTEGQFLLIRAAILAYEQTGANGWLTLAQNCATPLEDVFYRGQSYPANGTTYFLPHWLVNVKEPFTSKGLVNSDPLAYGYFDVEVSFTGGFGVIPAGGATDGELLSDVYSVYSQDGKLLWKNVYAPVSFGTQYQVAYWVGNQQLAGQRYRVYPSTASSSGRSPDPTTQTAGTIRLSTDYTGTLKVTYAAYTGPTIPINTGFEAYPMWRELLSGEIQAALDVGFWADAAYDGLYRYTNQAKFLNARNSNQYSMLLASVIPNLTAWYTPEVSENPFAYPGSQVITVNNPTLAIATRETTAGALQNFLKIAVAAAPVGNFPSIELQNFAVQAVIGDGTTIEVQVAHSRGGLLEVSVSTNPDPFNFSETYTAYLLVDASTATPVTRTRSSFDLIKWNSDLVWWIRAADNPVYTYGNATTELADVDIVDGDRTYKSVVSRTELDADGDFAGMGFTLLHRQVTRPPVALYRLTGDPAVIRLTDENDNKWEAVLPVSDAYTRFNQDWTYFDRVQGNDEPGSSFITNIEVEQTGDRSSVFRCWWIAADTRSEPESLPTEIRTYKASLVSREKQSFTMWVGNFRPVGSPSDAILYNPGVIPFTANSINGIIEAWRGIPLTGYQSPYTWQKWGEDDRLQQVLDFLKDAQDYYAKQNVNGTYGPFAPAFSWAYWDAGDFLANGLNGFGWNAPDPNTEWEGYMHRIVEDLCRAWKDNPRNNQMRQMAMAFLSWYDSYLTTSGGKPPTNYPALVDPDTRYECPHAAALMMRAAIFANLAGGNPTITFRIIRRSLTYLEDSYVTSGTMAGSWAKLQEAFTSGGQTFNSYFGFWHGEVVESYAVLIQYRDQLRLPPCVVRLV